MHDLYLKQFTTKFKKKKLLLHVCCAPDLVTPLIDLKNYFQLYLFWYNPNIQPFSEYQKRYKQYIKLLNLEK
jgi:predicted adenine nucleotide alpha hydrolase (AANH) superfamily ATPase